VYSFLFEEAIYLLNGIEIDRTRDVGITTTIKNFLSCPNQHQNALFGWQQSGSITTYNHAKKKFYAQIPLKKLFGFFEDYDKVIVNARQEIILLRASNDKNCCNTASNESLSLQIEKIELLMEHVEPNEELKLKMYQEFLRDRPIPLPFRKWELHELPALRKTTRDLWSVKTSTSLERPRYVIVCFQNKTKKNNHVEDATKFDHCNIRNIKIHLNSESYPYDSMNLDFSTDNYLTAYHMYTQFQSTYHNLKENEVSPQLTYTQFKDHPLFVFDVSHQNEAIKSSTIDLKIEMESDKSFDENICAYCLILYDSIAEYTPLTGIVRKLL
jgi:hypothetical protein